jgi:hypothetical protein
MAPADAVARADKSLVFDGVWGRDPPDTKYGFEEDVRLFLHDAPSFTAHTCATIHRYKHGQYYLRDLYDLSDDPQLLLGIQEQGCRFLPPGVEDNGVYDIEY